MTTINEDQIEQMTLDIFRELGWQVRHGAEISHDVDPDASLLRGVTTFAERDFGDVVLSGRLEQKIRELNPWLPSEKVDEVVRKITRTNGANDIDNIRQLSGYARDTGVLKKLAVFKAGTKEIDDEKVVDCVIIYPDTTKSDNFESRKLQEEKISGFTKFYKCGIKLTTKYPDASL